MDLNEVSCSNCGLNKHKLCSHGLKREAESIRCEEAFPRGILPDFGLFLIITNCASDLI